MTKNQGSGSGEDEVPGQKEIARDEAFIAQLQPYGEASVADDETGGK